MILVFAAPSTGFITVAKPLVWRVYISIPADSAFPCVYYPADGLPHAGASRHCGVLSSHLQRHLTCSLPFRRSFRVLKYCHNSLTPSPLNSYHPAKVEHIKICSGARGREVHPCRGTRDNLTRGEAFLLTILQRQRVFMCLFVGYVAKTPYLCAHIAYHVQGKRVKTIKQTKQKHYQPHNIL